MAHDTKGTGSGLSALLSADKSQSVTDEAFQIKIELIEASPAQPRIRFDEGGLRGLAESIRENGLVQPVIVRRKGTGYELIAGERRWRAAQLAGLTSILAVVRDVPDDKLLELALIENIQREDLNAIEEALAYKNLIEAAGLTQEVLAQRVGRDRSYITNYLRLLRLPDDLQGLVQDGRLSTGHARTLLGQWMALQRRLARQILKRVFLSGNRTSNPAGTKCDLNNGREAVKREVMIPPEGRRSKTRRNLARGSHRHQH